LVPFELPAGHHHPAKAMQLTQVELSNAPRAEEYVAGGQRNGAVADVALTKDPPGASRGNVVADVGQVLPMGQAMHESAVVEPTR